MTNSKFLSDYDKKTIQKLKDSKLLIIDLDGTLIDFEKIDNIIISTLFRDSKFVTAIDKLLWKINKLDVFGNGYTGLKLRLKVYSLFSKYTMKQLKYKYATLYGILAKKELRHIYNETLRDILKEGYSIQIVTKNVYAPVDLVNNLEKDLKNNNLDLTFSTLKKNKNKFIKENVKTHDGKACIIGNNLSDDIITSFRLGLPYIYIGNSLIVRAIIRITNKIFKNKGIQVTTFNKTKSLWNKKEDAE